MGFADREKSRSNHSVVAAMIDQSQEPEVGLPRGRPRAADETRKKVTISILPSIHDDAQKIAYVDRTSISEIVSECLKKYITDNADKLREYDGIKVK